MVGVIGAVSDEPAEESGTIQKAGRNGDIVDVAGCQRQEPRPPFIVRQRVELACPSAARGTDRLFERPPFPPAAERWALMWVLSIAAVP